MKRTFLEYVEEILESENIFEAENDTSMETDVEYDDEDEEEISDEDLGAAYIEVEEFDDTEDDEEEISETIKRMKVIRNGKKMIKFVTDKPGFKIVFVNGKPKEVKMTPQEIKTRQKAAKKAAKAKKGKQAQIAKKRAKSMAKR